MRIIEDEEVQSKVDWLKAEKQAQLKQECVWGGGLGGLEGRCSDRQDLKERWASCERAFLIQPGKEYNYDDGKKELKLSQ